MRIRILYEGRRMTERNETLEEMLVGKRVVVIGESLPEGLAADNTVAINGNPLDEQLVRVAWRMAPDYIILKASGR